jgi:hypothetical protein
MNAEEEIKKKKMFEGLLGGIIKKMSIIPTLNYSQ